MTRPSNEIRPNPRAEADSKSSGGDSHILADLDLIHAAYWTGRDDGFAEGQKFAARSLAQEILSRQAAVMAGEAVATARAERGDSWAEMIRQQAVAS